MTASSRAGLRPLHLLAGLHGVQLSYVEAGTGARRAASPESLLAALAALGAPLGELSEVPGALREVQQRRWQRLLEPVSVAWEGGRASTPLRLPTADLDGVASLELALEEGEVRRWKQEISELRVREEEEVEGTPYTLVQLPLPGDLPCGYHHLELKAAGGRGDSLVVCAPRRAHAPATPARWWGAFLPLHALRSSRDWGVGDVADLEAALDWLGERGGRVLGTLPLLAVYPEETPGPSPYSPLSRRFWSELFLAPERLPDLAAAGAIVESGKFQDQVRRLRETPLADFGRCMALKRRVLEPLAEAFFAGSAPDEADFRRYLDEHPDVEDYARFRAATEKLGPWRQWPRGSARGGRLDPGDYDEEAYRYHLYSQWRTHQQVEEAGRRARAIGPGLYLDLPLGVHREGYDTWRERRLFADRASAGAPPDSFFSGGQDWSTPPLHPEALREDRYRHYLGCLRHHLRQAGVLRIDHVMGFHRLFWVPQGCEPRDGVYVRYRPDEFYALLCLESERSKTMIVGEDLGTVPAEVRRTMTRRGLARTHVLQLELSPEADEPLPPVPAGSLATLNTHDLPPFASFWEARDLRDRGELGMLDAAGERAEHRRRDTCKRVLGHALLQGEWLEGSSSDRRAMLLGCLRYLAASPAALVMVNLEDLWGEVRPQNVPGTTDERPNWRRRARYPLERFSRMEQVIEGLELMRDKRAGGVEP